MALSFMRRPKVQLDVRFEERPLHPGGTIAVHVELTPGEAFEVREGVAELACIETYWEKHRDSTSSGSTTTSRVKRTERIMRVYETFLSPTQLARGVRYPYDVSLTLPSDVPPTVVGRKASISWRLKVSLDVPKARDVSEERPVEVLTSPPAGPAFGGQGEVRPAPIVAERTFDQCVLSLLLDNAQARPGDTLRGRFRVSAREDVSFNEARVELECYERAGELEDTNAEDRVLLQPDLSISARQTRDWPFELRVPPTLRPSMFASRTSVIWRVRGVLSRRLMTDFAVEKDIQVHTARGEQGR